MAEQGFSLILELNNTKIYKGKDSKWRQYKENIEQIFI